MLINKTLLTIAEELRFKVIKDRIFGVFDGQYICICRTQQGYLLFAYVDSSARSVIERLNQNNGICKAIGFKRGRAEFEFGHLVIHGLGAQIFPSKTKSLIKETIKNLAALLNQNQKFVNPSTESTILIDGIPTPHDERYIKAAEEELLKVANKKIDYTAGIMLGLVCSLGVGVALGVFSWLGNKYAQSDINPFGKGVLAAGTMMIIYGKIAGGVDKKSRLIVALLSIFTFIVWDLTLIFLKIYDSSNAVYSIEKLVEIYSKQFLNQTTMGNYALVAIGSIIFASYLLRLRTDRTKLDLRGVGLTIEASIERIKNLKKLENRFGFAFVAGILLLMGPIFLITTIPHRFEYFSFTPFMVLFVSLLGLLIPATHFFLKNKKIVKIAYFDKETNADERRAYWALIFFLNLFIPTSICFVFSYLNVVLDKTAEQVIQARTDEDYSPSNGDCNSIELVSDKYGDFNRRICAPEAYLVKKGELAEVKMRGGYFDMPYLLDLTFPNLSSYKKFAASRESESDFRSNVIHYFYKIDKSAHFQEKFKEWESSCLKTPGYECRLRAYIYRVDKNNSQALKFLKRACAASEPISCHGVYLNEEATMEDKQQAINLLKVNCLEKRDNYCLELAFSLWNSSYEKNRDEIKRILDESCERGYEKACEARDGL